MSMFSALKSVFNGVSPRTSLAENKTMSKADRRGGVNGSKYDYPHSSTGQSHINEINREPNPLPASESPRHVGYIGKPHVEQVGFLNGQYRDPTFAKPGLITNAVSTHPALKPKGLSEDASGIGGKSVAPTQKDESYRTRMDSGALAGDSAGGRPSYTGGKGPIRP
jgi:hypothetical protein